MNIGDLLWKLGIEKGGLVTEVEAEADKAGAAGAQKLSSRLKSAFKTEGAQALGLAVSGALAIATKGANEAENAMASFRAETGATAEEARAAFESANQAAGDHRQSLQDVTDTQIALRKNLGLTGKALDEQTDSMTRYARVTKQSGVEAVGDFDDILDSFNLDASKTVEIQDKIIASTQKYGGSAQDMQKALAASGSELQALNLSYDDGIELLNLFAASGVDAADSQKALQQAVKRLKPGQSFDDIVRELGAITNQTERARKAAEIFGPKLGDELANAIKPGMRSLDDFGVSLEESTGKAKDAEEALDSTFGARIQKIISQAGAKLREFGSDFGPALTGAASLSTLAATVFPGVGSKLAKGLLGGLRGIGGKIFGKIAAETATGAGSEVIGDAIGKAVSKGAGGSLAKGIGDALSKVPGSSAFGKGIDAINGGLKSKIGKGIAITVAVTAVIDLVQTYNDLQNMVTDQLKGISENAQQQLKTSTTDALKIQRDALQQGIKDLDEFSKHDPIGAWIAGADRSKAELQTQLDGTLKEIELRAAGSGEAAGQAFVGGVGSGIAEYAPTVRDHFNKSVGDALSQTTFRDRLYAKGADAVSAFAEGINSARAKPVDAFEQLKEALKHPLTRTQEAARLAGQLSSKELAAGLKSGDPAIRAQAEATRQLILERLKQLQGEGGTRGLGKKAMDELRTAMKSKDPAVRRAAYEIYKTAKGQLDKTKKAGKDAGSKGGQGVADGLNTKRTAVYNAAYALARKVGLSILQGIRAGAGIGGNGPNPNDPDIIGHASGGPIEAFQTYMVGEEGRELAIFPRNGLMLPHDLTERLMAPRVNAWRDAPVAAQQAVTTIHQYNIPLPGILQVRTAEDIVRPLRQLAETGVFERDKRLVTASPRPVRG